MQSLRHEELLLEMSSIKKQARARSWLDGSPEGTVTPGEETGRARKPQDIYMGRHEVETITIK